MLLIAGLLTRPAAALLAGDMVGAIVTAGRVEGGAINLVLAPTLLVAMLVPALGGAGPVGARQPSGKIEVVVAHALAFLGVSALVIVTPGQDTALTIRNTLLGGRRRVS